MLQRDIASRPGLVATSLGDRVSVTGSALSPSGCPVQGSYTVLGPCCPLQFPTVPSAFQQVQYLFLGTKIATLRRLTNTCMLPATPRNYPTFVVQLTKVSKCSITRCVTSCWSGRGERQFLTTGAIIHDLAPFGGERVELRGVALRRAPRFF